MFYDVILDISFVTVVCVLDQDANKFCFGDL